ncbi:peptide/nickel transport system substrate-binding protein [Bradyrhizobium sp. F1.4.3]|uniref:ABC transporter substrate-binding protein n=1 Tax=Bradyrhizobium sp. F1.4.3 TaxID=3156356 RepID=UPI0033966E99
MTISRRDLIKSTLAGGMAVSVPSVVRAQTAPTASRSVRMVMNGDLRNFDPVSSTGTITADHALAIYDTLFSQDSKGMPHPQMVGKWGVSDDKKTYTFELRDGLSWHDGTPVTAGDCVASIRRWGQGRPGGRLIMERSKDISKKDDKTFTIVLKEPLGILIDTLADSGGICFVMREKDADRSATEQVTANIGSGPFKFNQALANPGASFTYDRNERYVPRQEPPDALAGGKVVKVDRVIWDNIGDQQTALGALQTGQVDYVASIPFDLLPMIKSNLDLVVEVVDKTGSDLFVRMNCLQKPFDSVKARQAMLHLIDQEAFLRILRPDPQYAFPITSPFGHNSPYANDENTGWYKKGGDPDRAKQLFKEAGYAGEKVVILDPTNAAWSHNPTQLVAASLRKIGVNVELAGMDWGQLLTLQPYKGPIDKGGWSIFVSAWSDLGLGNPVTTSFLQANGEDAWSGWPKNDEYEALRSKWSNVETFDERQALARKMQGLWWDFVGAVFLGGVISPIARRKTLTGLVAAPGLKPMWNMQKA